MQTQCSESRIEFHGLGERVLTADFDGGNIVSDGGVPLIAGVDRMFRVLERYADCFTDHRDSELTEHSVLDLVRQRIYGLCLGYEDLNDHDLLRADSLIAACVGKQDLEGQERRREADRGMPMAGKSTLNRLELSKVGADPDSPYCKIVADLDGMAHLRAFDELVGSDARTGVHRRDAEQRTVAERSPEGPASNGRGVCRYAGVAGKPRPATGATSDVRGDSLSHA